MLPIVKPYQATATYAGLPTESYSKLIDSVASTFDKNKTAARALDIALSQIKYNEGDKPLAEGIINKYKEAIDGIAKDAAGNTRYDLATQQVDNTMLDFAKNTNLQHIGKQWAAAEEDRKRLLDPDYNIKYIGEPNTKDFRSINPDGTLNYYKPTVETRLKHEDKAKEIISRVSPEIINSVEGLSDQEKQMIGSQGLYKFITTEKKDSDTYKKVWNYIRNVAKSTPELDQYLRFKGEDALDNLLLNEGLLTQYQNQKVNIQQSPTTTIDKSAIESQNDENNYVNSFNIESTGTVRAGTKGSELLPEDDKAYNSKIKSVYLPNSAPVGGLSKLTGTTTIKTYDEEAHKEILRYKNLIPQLRKLSDVQAAKEINKNKLAFDQEINTKFGNTDLVIRNNNPVVSGSKLDVDGMNIKSQDTNVVLLNGDRKDKATFKEKLEKAGVEFNFEKPVKSTFMGINLSMNGNASSNGGYIYLLEDADGNKQQVIKYDDNFNKTLKPFNDVFTKLYKLVEQTPEEKLRSKATHTDYTVINTNKGSIQVRPVLGNLKTYKFGKNITIPNVGEGIDARIELIDNDGDVTYFTAEQFQTYIAESLVKEPSFRNNFKKPNID
jgi:hypothetical protein